MVYLLTKETFFNDMIIEMFFRLEQQGARACRRIIDFVNVGLTMQR